MEIRYRCSLNFGSMFTNSEKSFGNDGEFHVFIRHNVVILCVCLSDGENGSWFETVAGAYRQ